MKLRLFITLLLFLVLPLNSLYAYKSVSSSYDNVLGGTTIYYSDGTSSDYMPNAFGGYNIYDGGYLNSSNYGTGSDTGITYNFFEDGSYGTSYNVGGTTYNFKNNIPKNTATPSYKYENYLNYSTNYIKEKNTYFCPDSINSYIGSDNYCYCKSGLIWNEFGNKCIKPKIICGQNAFLNNKDNKCYCKVGYIWASSDITNTNCKKNTTQDNIYYAISNGDEDSIKNIIKKGINLNAVKTSNEMSPLRFAVLSGNEKIVKILIQAGANINEVDKKNSSILISACLKHTGAAKLLIDAGANVNFKGWGKLTPLAIAIGSKNYRLSILLINKGANPNYIFEGKPLLIERTIANDVKAIKLLLEGGANPNLIDDLGNTALIYASYYGYKDIVKTLLEDNRTKLKISNKKGSTAISVMSISTSKNKDAILSLLKNPPKNINIFTDLKSNHYRGNAIKYLKNNKIISGYPDGSFKPNKTVNRAELMKILIGSNLPSGTYENCFKDVKKEWFAPYVCYGKKMGWIQGYANGTFKPAQTVNRAEAIKMAIEVFGLSTATKITNNPYNDVSKDSWFAKYVHTAKESGLFDYMINYKASNGMTRVDISDIIYRLLTIKKLKLDKYQKGKEVIIGTQPDEGVKSTGEDAVSSFLKKQAEKKKALEKEIEILNKIKNLDSQVK